MPGGDRTGPEGKGPKTGRMLGNCTVTERDQVSNDQENARDLRGLGRGLARRFGRLGGLGRLGRGFGGGGGRGGGRGLGRGLGRGNRGGRARQGGVQ